MRNMQVLVLLLVTLALTAAQFHQRYRNPGFRNTHTPLAASASRERPYLSIPIVLMPDGQIVPKPAQASYQYLGNMPTQGHQRNSKTQRGTTVLDREADESYRVVVPPPSSHTQDLKQTKATKSTANGRNTGVMRDQRGNGQIMQQNHVTKYLTQNEQGQTVTVIQLPNQRNPTAQQQVISNQQIGEAHKQNVANFINFATHLGADVLTQQRGVQRNHQSKQVSSTDTSYVPSEGQRVQETYVLQSPPTQNQVNGYTYTQTVQHSAPQTQQSIQQKPHVTQHGNYNIPQMQYQSSTPASTTVQYIQASNIKQPGQAISLQTGVQSQATGFHQNMGPTVYFPGSQNNPSQSNTYMQSVQQAGHQNYQIVNPQQANSHVQLIPAGNYESQTPTKFVSQPQIQLSNHDASAHSDQPNYGGSVQNGDTYITVDEHQISFANGAQASPVSYRIQQNGHQNNPNPQHATQLNSQSNLGQSADQKIYVPHQNSQEVTTAVTFPQYVSSLPNSPVNYPQQASSQSYTDLSNNQNIYVNQNGHAVYRSPSQSNTGPNTQSTDVGTYTYANTQPTYASSGQTNQEKYANVVQTPNTYQHSQYEYPAQNKQNEKKNSQQESATSAGGGQLIYASSSAKQINYTPSMQDYSSSQQQSNAGESPAYVSFPNFSSGYKSQSATSGEVSSGTPYMKQSQSGQSDDQQFETTNQDSGKEEEEEETSYKVVYVPLDVLKNIINNRVETPQRYEKSS